MIKKGLRYITIILLTISIIIGTIRGYFYRTSQTYRQTSGVDTTTAIMRTIKTTLRANINKTHNAALLQIRQNTYTLLHQRNIKRQQKGPTTTREHTIKTDNSILQISIQIPGSIGKSINTKPMDQSNGIVFEYDKQYLGSLQVYSDTQRTEQETQGVFNQEKVAEKSGYILVYAQVLDNPFTGIQLETFGEIAAIFNNTLGSVQIDTIKDITYTVAFITSIQTGNTENTITIDPIQLFTGEQAAQMLATNDPELCKSIISGTNNSLCFPPNDIYIFNETKEDVRTLQTITSEGIQIIVELIHSSGSTQPQWTTPETLRTQRDDKYRQTPFHIYSIQNNIIQITEQYIP